MACSEALTPFPGLHCIVCQKVSNNMRDTKVLSPQDKSHAPEKEAPESQKDRFTPQGGGSPAEGFGPLVLSSVDGQARAGCLALSSMGSMATAIRKSTRGPYSTTLQRRRPLFSPRAGDCTCRVSSGCWPPRNGWETA